MRVKMKTNGAVDLGNRQSWYRRWHRVMARFGSPVIDGDGYGSLCLD